MIISLRVLMLRMLITMMRALKSIRARVRMIMLIRLRMLKTTPVPTRVGKTQDRAYGHYHGRTHARDRDPSSSCTKEQAKRNE